MQFAMYWLIVVARVSATTQPWSCDYGAALRAAEQDGKPVLVVIGEGEDGWRGLVPEGWSMANLRLISEHFHGVYVNARDGGYGAELAKAFAFRQLPALVISDRRGQTQALRREGTMTDGELQRLLAQHVPSETFRVRGSVPTAGGNASGSIQLNKGVPATPPVLLCPT